MGEGGSKGICAYDGGKQGNFRCFGAYVLNE